jgi:hypothetical protein
MAFPSVSSCRRHWAYKYGAVLAGRFKSSSSGCFRFFGARDGRFSDKLSGAMSLNRRDHYRTAPRSRRYAWRFFRTRTA